MLVKTASEIEETLSALRGFGKSGQSENIRNNVIMFRGKTIINGKLKDNYGSGLLLTENGFFLTAHHVVAGHNAAWASIKKDIQQGSIDSARVIDYMTSKYCIIEQSGKKSTIDPTVFTHFLGYDLAIGRALRVGDPRSIGYDVCKEDPKEGEELSLCALTSRGLHESTGVVTKHTISIHQTPSEFKQGKRDSKYDAFGCAALSERGMSGGSYINNVGQLSGIVISYEGDDNFGPSKGAKIRHIENLVERMAKDIEKEHHS